MASREDYAWAAGFIDGEGSFTTNPTACRPPRLQIGQKDKEVLQRFHDIFPFSRLGSYEKRTRTPNGDRHEGQFWQVQVNGLQRVQAVVAATWPWLSQVKRAQYRATLSTYQEWPRKRGPRFAERG